MKKSELYRALRSELHRHDFSTFVDEPPSVAKGGNGVVVPGCPMCKKRFGTTPQFLDHLTDDVLPAVLDRLSTTARRFELAAEPRDLDVWR
jgi:hypothetical protein